MRIFKATKETPCAASIDFLFLCVRRGCPLTGTIFSSGFLSTDRYWNDSLRRKIGASGGISLARNDYLLQKRKNHRKMPDQQPAWLLQIRFFPCREEGVKLTMARNSCPKVAFALSHVELNAI
jgi:hypothetical protein